MIQDIIDEITYTLNYKIKDISINLEVVEQGFEKPSFFILPINETEEILIGDRAKRTVTFDVHYFTGEINEPKADLLKVANSLYPVFKRLEKVKTDENGEIVIDEETRKPKFEPYLNGFNLHHEIVDGVLHFFVTYKYIVIYNDDVSDNMQVLERVKINGKN